MKIVGMAIALLVLPAVGSRADINPNAPIEVQGTVKNVYSDYFTIIAQPSSTIKSEDSNLVKTGELGFNVDSNTIYENFARLNELKEGEAVTVAYREESKSRKNVALAVTLGSSSRSSTTTTTTSTTITAP